MRPLYVGDDFLGHPNRAVPTLFLLPNLVSNHLAIVHLLDHIGGVFALVLPVGLGVDERTFDCDLFFVLLIWKLLLWLRELVGLVAFLMALEACHGGPFNLAKSFMSLSTSCLSSSFSLAMRSSHDSTTTFS